MAAEPQVDWQGNYFNYFTEVEEHFQRTRGTSLFLFSPLDWALIETWKDAGIPLEAVLRGIDATFDNYERRPSKTRKINGLGFCAQEVFAAAESMTEASVGAARDPERNKGFDPAEIATFLRKNASELRDAKLPARTGISVQAVASDAAESLDKLAAEIEGQSSASHLEDLERRVTVLEDKLFAALLTVVPDDEIVAIREQADRELAPYRGKMQAPQIEQLRKQYLHKRLLERYKLPRLSLFYL